MEYEFELTEKRILDIKKNSLLSSKELMTQSATHLWMRWWKRFNRICTFPESGEVLDNKFVPTDMIRILGG